MGESTRDDGSPTSTGPREAVTQTRELPRIAVGLTVSEPYPNVAIYTVTAPLGHAEFDHYLADMTRRLDHGQPHVIILNLKISEPLPAWQRERQAAWLAEQGDALARVSRGVAIVASADVPDETVSTLMTAPDAPGNRLVCKSLAEALFFAQNRLRGN